MTHPTRRPSSSRLLIELLRVYLVWCLLADIRHLSPRYLSPLSTAPASSLVMVHAAAAPEAEEENNSSSEDELPPDEEDEHEGLSHDEIDEDEEELYDDDYLRKYTLDIDDSENDCRDITDTFLNCTEARERGLCDPTKRAAVNDLMDVIEVCPATCGTCSHPPTQTAVWVDVECYDYEEDIRVYLTNTHPEPDDFVAIYPSYIDIEHNREDTDQSEMWLFACGNVQEHCGTASGGVIFGKRGISPYLQWYYFPLAPGRYKAALLRYNGTFLAESQTFTAKAQDHSCLWDCKDSVYTDDSCYSSDHETIHVTFENCAARNADRIAIYGAASKDQDGDDSGSRIGQNQQHEPLLWLDACHTQDCMGGSKSDYVSFGGGATSSALRHLMQGEGTWPLPPGEYVASLVRVTEGGLPHGRVVTNSPVFQVMEQGHDCPSATDEEEDSDDEEEEEEEL